MPASIRIIKIIKDPVTQTEAYTVEFECEADKAKDLLRELTASPYGQRAIELLNQAQFLPEEKHKTVDELKKEAELEEKEREEHEEEMKDRGRKEGITKMFAFLRKKFGDDFVKELEESLAEDREKEETAKAALVEDNIEPE